MNEKIFNKFTIVTTLFVMLLIISNLLATKMIMVLGFVLPAAVIVYPFCFMVGDVLTEVWGFKIAKKVIWLGFFMNLLLIIFTNIAIPLTYPEFWKGQEHFQFIFGAIPRIVLASFIGYLVGELSNSWLLELIKKITNGKWLFIRTIGSSMVGQIFDTVLFITIAFYGTIPNEVLITMVIAQYIFKVLCEALAGTPLAYGLVRWVKHENSIS